METFYGHFVLWTTNSVTHRSFRYETFIWDVYKCCKGPIQACWGFLCSHSTPEIACRHTQPPTTYTPQVMYMEIKPNQSMSNLSYPYSKFASDASSFLWPKCDLTYMLTLAASHSFISHTMQSLIYLFCIYWLFSFSIFILDLGSLDWKKL